MYVKAIPDNKKGRDGYYCSLVESRRVDGKSHHVLIQSLGYVPSEAVFASGDGEKKAKKEP
jgi:hypothetical protein